MSSRRVLTLLTTALVLALAPHGRAFQPQVVDVIGDAVPERDVSYALFETVTHPEGRVLQITLGLSSMPDPDQGATYTVAFDYGACGGGRVTYDWNGGGTLSGYAAGLASTNTRASFWTCHSTATVGRDSVYSYTSRDITVTWLDNALQFWVPLSAAKLKEGTALTNTRACSGQTVYQATTDLRRRTGIDCTADSSPFGKDYVVGG